MYTNAEFHLIHGIDNYVTDNSCHKFRGCGLHTERYMYCNATGSKAEYSLYRTKVAYPSPITINQKQRTQIHKIGSKIKTKNNIS